MKDKKQRQIKSLALLLIIVFQAVYPTTALALADIQQPEFGAFEDFNTTDMVDLSTGDFSYNIPLLNVSSPEGGFQLPLSYHAGIQLNEEASWVGLGWNVNPGVMTRSSSMLPDDYSGEQVSTDVTNPGGTGYVITYPFYTEYYDSQKGKSGAISILGLIDIGTGANAHVGIAPLGLDFKDGGASFDSKYMVQGLSNAAGIALACVGDPAMVAFNLSFNAAGSMIQGYVDMMDKHSSIGTGVSPDIKLTTATPNKGYAFGLFGKRTDYKWFIDDHKVEQQYGTLYLGNMPVCTIESGNDHDKVKARNNSSSDTDADNNGKLDNMARLFKVTNNDGVGHPPFTSDMYYYYTSADDYVFSKNPSNLSYDNYSVKGAGVSGSIKPYRKDVGTLSQATISSDMSSSYFGPKFQQDSTTTGNYKVQFRYMGDFSNSYTFHNMGSANLAQNAFPYSISHSMNGSDFEFVVNFTNQISNVNYEDMTDSNNDFFNHYPSSSNHTFTQANRTDSSLYNNRLVHGRNIEWFSNREIINASAKSKGFMDTHQSQYADRSLKAKHQIGGFSITNDAGVTYHYSVPVYTWDNIYCSLVTDQTQTNPTTTTNKVKDNNAYAIAWLLTGITGPDFIDRTGNGIIDDNDWGYWVKFDYGCFCAQYAFRSPYHGVNGVPNNSISFQNGKRQAFYLNRIATRTHSALFVKSRRLDGKGYYESDGVDEVGTSITNEPSESLKLSDIYLLENSDYSKLTTNLGLNTNNSGSVLTANLDSYNEVLDSMDIVNTAGAATFLNQNQLERIHFNYSYDLCHKTDNSFSIANSVPTNDGAQGHPSGTTLFGKLTLNSIDYLTKNNARVMPGYIFKYGNVNSSADNPDYSYFAWDGSGMYKSGSTNQNPYYPHNCEKKADQWSLTDVVTPLSSTIHVEYERDDYTSINGKDVTDSPLQLLCTSGVQQGSSSITVSTQHLGSTTSLSDLVAVGDVVNVSESFPNGASINVNLPIQSISGNVITIAGVLPVLAGVSYNLLTIRVKVHKKFGGDIRVKSITTFDEANSYKTKYIYTKNGREDGVSSGVASYENQSEKGTDYDFYKYAQHPYTSIMYSNVSVVSGDVNNTFNEKSRTAYHFVTPHYSLLSVTNDSNNNGFGIESGDNAIYYSLWGNICTVDRTSVIGNLDTVKVYNKYNNLVNKTVFEYGDQAQNPTSSNMGCYTENTLLWEYIRFNNSSPHKFAMRFLQSYVLSKPNFLRSITSYKDRLVSKEEYTYDYKTGHKIATKNTYGNSETYESVSVPAFYRYPSMGSKALDPMNKNMMSAESDNYNYVYDDGGNKRLLAASVKTWQKTQNYRDYDLSTGYSSNSYSGTYSTPYQNAWQAYRTYNWKSLVEENGTISNFVPFAWSSPNGTQNSNWIQTSEATLYDHYSHSLESKDIYGRYRSAKYGYNQSYAVSGCGNARYTEWCYSGAEDKNPANTGYYEGEVGCDPTAQYLSSSIYAHTGNYCSRVAQGALAFKYAVPVGGVFNKKYRGSVWIHASNAQFASLECLAGSSTNTSWIGSCNSSQGYINPGVVNWVTNGTAEHIGSFFLLNLDVDVSQLPPGTTQLIFQVRNATGSGSQYIYADDFRVHPLSTPIVAQVLEPKSGKVMATLDGDNMATKYVYDNTGRLSNTFKETKYGFKMVSDIKYNYNR